MLLVFTNCPLQCTLLRWYIKIDCFILPLYLWLELRWIFMSHTGGVCCRCLTVWGSVNNITARTFKLQASSPGSCCLLHRCRFRTCGLVFLAPCRQLSKLLLHFDSSLRICLIGYMPRFSCDGGKEADIALQISNLQPGGCSTILSVLSHEFAC